MDLFLPWLCSDMVILVLMVATFTFTCFLSFFVDLLVAIVFPVVAGLVLGVWSLLWHRVRAAYLAMGVGGNPEDPWNFQTRMMSRKSLRSRVCFSGAAGAEVGRGNCTEVWRPPEKS